MKIPSFLDRDNYLQNPIMRRFLKANKLEMVNTRADYIAAIERFSDESEENEEIVRNWLLKIVKEGSKELCYRKIRGIGERHKDPLAVDGQIREAFPDCPRKNILTYKNTDKMQMIEYHIITNQNGEAEKLEFTFSKLYLCGEEGKEGETTIYPIFVEVYLQEGFIVSRAKAKSTLYPYDESNPMTYGATRINTMTVAVSVLDQIVKALEFVVELDSRKVVNENSKMLYRLYDKYSFTPADVEARINTQKELIDNFVNQLFANLSLDICNKEKALIDGRILVEKFISINGDNEAVFKEDRDAYLIKVCSDDETELTSINTKSEKSVPLQCTEAFFDSKKSVIKGQQCKKLNMVFKRNDETYFTGVIRQLEVQFGTKKNYGYVKTIQYAEEADIQNVLQAIFSNY